MAYLEFRIEESEFWRTTKPRWDALCQVYLDRMKFVDLEFASLRHILYSINKGNAPSRRLNSFMFFEQEDTRTDEKISEDLMQQMMGLINL